MSQCGRPGCHWAAKSSCSGCEREDYCGSDCQKLDWKDHKSMCPILKKFSKELQPYNKAIAVIDEVMESKKIKDIRFLGHLLSYAHHQLGKQVTGTIYLERKDGQRINNFSFAVILAGMNSNIAGLCRIKKSIGGLDRNDKKLRYHLERSLSLLNPWLLQLNTDVSSRTDDLTKGQINQLLKQLSSIEFGMAKVAMDSNQFDVAEEHCQRCLTYSKRLELEREQKTNLNYEALRLYVDLRECQANYSLLRRRIISFLLLTIVSILKCKKLPVI
jgi:hypothetical protein